MDPSLRSWVESANDPMCDFPIQNLPLCAFLVEHDGHRHAHLGLAIGDQILDVSLLNEAGFFAGPDERLPNLLRYPFWDGVASAPGSLAGLRAIARDFLDAGTTTGGQQARRLRSKALRPIAEARFLPPMRLGNYTDFYASIHHATTVGSMFRPDQPLLPNYKWVPIGYHGRASSIDASPSAVRRPRGQIAPPDERPGDPPTFSASTMLDYELEVGVYIGVGNARGEPVPIARAQEHILGLSLVNDWSARDIQKWEYQPLGPFLAKNFATTVSPFIVTLDALAPFRCPAYARPAGDPRPLGYLWDDSDQAHGGFDLTLEVWLRSREMETRGLSPVLISKSRAFKDMYWTFAQMLTHHTSNGCNLVTGDLIASGTVSGREPTERGCLLERTWQGRGPDPKPLPRLPIELPSGEKRTFLGDGDEVIMRGYCERDGFPRIGLGECRGTITPSA
jgi:fumarylacetoacetase